MSVRLLAEVRDHAPADLTPAEVLVLVWIADQSRDEARKLDNGRFVPARTCFPGTQDLARWCHVSETGLRKVFARLADRDLDVRVQQATDKNGNPVYAIRGRRMVLRLPVLGDTAGSPNEPEGDTHGSPEGIPQGPLGRYPGVPSGDTAGSPTLNVPREVPREENSHAENRGGVRDDPGGIIEGKIVDPAADDFETFWAAYPRRAKKPEAAKAFAKALTRTSAEIIIEGVQRMAADPNLPITRFIPHPANWLNEDGWENDPYPPQSERAARDERAMRWAMTADETGVNLWDVAFGAEASAAPVAVADDEEADTAPDDMPPPDAAAWNWNGGRTPASGETKQAAMAEMRAHLASLKKSS